MLSACVHRAAERVLVDVADREVLEHAAGPARFDRHQIVPSARQARDRRRRRIRARRESRRCAAPSAGTAPIDRGSTPSIATGGSERAQRPGRRVDVAPAVARGELRMGDEVRASSSSARRRCCAASSRSMSSLAVSGAEHARSIAACSAARFAHAQRVRREIADRRRAPAGRARRRRTASTRARSESPM